MGILTHFHSPLSAAACHARDEHCFLKKKKFKKKICILPLLVVDGRLEFQEWEYACVSSLQVGAKYKVSGSWVWSLFCNICSYLYLKKKKKKKAGRS